MDIKKKDIDIIKEFKYIGIFCCGGLGCGERFSKFEKNTKKLNWENFSNKQSLVYGVLTIPVYTSLVLKWHLSNNCCNTCYTTCADLDRGLKLKKKIKMSENRLLEYPPPPGKKFLIDLHMHHILPNSITLPP